MQAGSIRRASLEHTKLVLVLVLAVAFATFQTPVRAAPGDEADLSITGSASSPGVKVDTTSPST